MMQGLKQEVVEKINSVFAYFPEIKTAVLYGSRAKGNYRHGSDIDLTLYGPDLTLDLCADVADRLDDLLLPYCIDLSIFNCIDNAELQDHIERVGIIFYTQSAIPDLTKN